MSFAIYPFTSGRRKKTVEIDVERLQRIMNNQVRDDNVTGHSNIAIGYQAYQAVMCSGAENTMIGGVPELYPEVNRPIYPPPAPQPCRDPAAEYKTCKHCGAPEQIGKCQYCGCAIPQRRRR